ncbi:MAG: DUF4826 family protein [Gammaproteobacteria bacterium]|nr:DUF4826 family protein [Gammaproteobacteria bacterium]
MIDREYEMTESNEDAEREALESWYKHLLDNVVKEMVRIKAVSGVAVQAAPMWVSPYQILIAKVWGVGHENDFIWTISIDKLIADYLAGSLATSPQQVARHFSLKWQMDADRLAALELNKTSGENADERMQAYSKRLIAHAESLYDLANRDEIWQERQSLST